jgi:hypothetical protein
VKLGEITVNGKQVSVFKPPHEEPDFPWVDVEQLAKAFLPRQAAKRIVEMTRKFGGDHRSYATARNGDRIAIIVCHAMAQGLVGMIDHFNGYVDEEESGPAHQEYCFALGKFSADKAPMSFDDLMHAFHNPGGAFLRDAKL